ncbi:hypothetical protein HF086_005651 [Spodoptera exigua]|uniref:Uncharacterized protein n=1 Tax=Spodoptera exigua TaxID=7107 RepID=A0A922SPR5_SPOEX|nr:hypothetical protein HF086_005651 [Spodoptera exigua]
MRGDTQTEGDWKTIDDEPKKMKSEILKLEGKYGFSFVNNAAEGECNMRGDTQTEGDWKTIEDEPKKIKSVA